MAESGLAADWPGTARSDKQKSDPRPGRDAAVLGLVCVALGLVLWMAARRPADVSGIVAGTMAGRVNDRIDPNSAEWYELAQLPGVGETIARRIVAERESRRAAGKPGFGSAGDLDCVPGIGPAMLHRISRHVGPGPRGASIDRVEGGG